MQFGLLRPEVRRCAQCQRQAVGDADPACAVGGVQDGSRDPAVFHDEAVEPVVGRAEKTLGRSRSQSARARLGASSLHRHEPTMPAVMV